jgi:intracellular sulfur oxidation DsrE/DsrF family protein
MSYRGILLAFFVLGMGAAHAGEDAFTTGPVFEDFGPVADVETTFAIPEGAILKHSFDVSKKAEEGELNKTLVSAARFINMHARAGVSPGNIHVAVIVHGGAVRDVTNAEHYEEAVGGENASAALIEALLKQNVRIIVCGQSAAYYDVGTEDLLPGIEMALSAMTAHALLQQEGYSINPF